MKKLLLIVCSVFFTIAGSVAQQIAIDPNARPAKERVYAILDTCILRVQYRMLSVADTKKPENKKENIMLLQIGKHISKFSDYHRVLEDSLWNVFARNKTNFTEAINKTVPMLRGTLAISVYKNYPEGKITVVDRIPFDNYRYQEPLFFQEWKLENNTSAVCGYQCKKAITTFRGRNYTAWYAPEIPINNGPWKFGGLPGLILKVEDDNNHYSFECIGIEKMRRSDPINYYAEGNYIETTIKEFLQAQKNYYSNPGTQLQNSGKVKSELPASARKSRPYNPIELSD